MTAAHTSYAALEEVTAVYAVTAAMFAALGIVITIAGIITPAAA